MYHFSYFSVYCSVVYKIFWRMKSSLDLDRNLKAQGFHFNGNIKKSSTVRLIWVISIKLSTDIKFPVSHFSLCLLGANGDALLS